MTHLSLPTSHSNIYEPPGIGNSFLCPAFRSVVLLDPRIKKDIHREGGHASSSFLGARPAVTKIISAHPIIGGVCLCVNKLSHSHDGWWRMRGVFCSENYGTVRRWKEKRTGCVGDEGLRYLWSLRLNLACTSKGTLEDRRGSGFVQ